MFEKRNEEGADYCYWIQDEDGDPYYPDQHPDAMRKTAAGPDCIVISDLYAEAIHPALKVEFQ